MIVLGDCGCASDSGWKPNGCTCFVGLENRTMKYVHAREWVHYVGEVSAIYP